MKTREHLPRRSTVCSRTLWRCSPVLTHTASPIQTWERWHDWPEKATCHSQLAICMSFEAHKERSQVCSFGGSWNHWIHVLWEILSSKKPWVSKQEHCLIASNIGPLETIRISSLQTTIKNSLGCSHLPTEIWKPSSWVGSKTSYRIITHTHPKLHIWESAPTKFYFFSDCGH